MSEGGVNVSVLDNGMRVVSHHMPHVETVSLGVWANVGARSEAVDEHGISHMLEHMAFKGTAKRSARDIAEHIENVGGDVNAATSYDNTAYYVRMMKEDVALAVDILSDILLNSAFQPVEIEREREVILQEIAASNDSPDDIVFDLAQEAAFAGQSLGRTILGTEKSVSSFTADHFRSYVQKHYTAPNMIVSAAGAVDHDKLVSEVEQGFSTLGSEAAQSYEPATYVGGIKTEAGSFEQSHLVLGFEAFSIRDQDYFTGQIFSSILGGGMSSRLFQEVREERGLCYNIYSFCWGMADTGLFGIHAATGAEQVGELIDIVVKQLTLIAEEGPHDDEIKRAKAQLKAGLLMSLESTGARAEQLARHMIFYNRPMTTEELIAKVDEVGALDIRAVARRIISQSAPFYSAVGPSGDFQGYDWLHGVFSKS